MGAILTIGEHPFRAQSLLAYGSGFEDLPEIEAATDAETILSSCQGESWQM